MKNKSVIIVDKRAEDYACIMPALSNPDGKTYTIPFCGPNQFEVLPDFDLENDPYIITNIKSKDSFKDIIQLGNERNWSVVSYDSSVSFYRDPAFIALVSENNIEFQEIGNCLIDYKNFENQIDVNSWIKIKEAMKYRKELEIGMAKEKNMNPKNYVKKPRQVVLEIHEGDALITTHDLVVKDACKDSLKRVVKTLGDKLKHGISYKEFYAYLKEKNYDSDASWLKSNFGSNGENEEYVEVGDISDSKMYIGYNKTSNHYSGIEGTYKNGLDVYRFVPLSFFGSSISVEGETLKDLFINLLTGYFSTIVYEFDDFDHFVDWYQKEREYVK